MRYVGNTVKGLNGTVAVIIDTENGDVYRIDPLGKETGFYSEVCAVELADNHAALANKRGRIDNFVNVRKV